MPLLEPGKPWSQPAASTLHSDRAIPVALACRNKVSYSHSGQAKGRAVTRRPRLPGEGRPVISQGGQKSQGGCVILSQDRPLSSVALRRSSLWRPLPTAGKVRLDGSSKTGPQTGRKTKASHFAFFMYIFCCFSFFSVKCPSSSITYKHDLYRGVDGRVGGVGRGWGSSSSCCPLPPGQGPGPFRGWGRPNTSLRLSGCLCP